MEPMTKETRKFITEQIKFMDNLVALDRCKQSDSDWDAICDMAVHELKPLQKHIETWGSHCGAPKAVYIGHLVRMIIDIHALSV